MYALAAASCGEIIQKVKNYLVAKPQGFSRQDIFSLWPGFHPKALSHRPEVAIKSKLYSYIGADIHSFAYCSVLSQLKLWVVLCRHSLSFSPSLQG